MESYWTYIIAGSPYLYTNKKIQTIKLDHIIFLPIGRFRHQSDNSSYPSIFLSAAMGPIV